jgi:hypothetical protein
VGLTLFGDCAEFVLALAVFLSADHADEAFILALLGSLFARRSCRE